MKIKIKIDKLKWLFKKLKIIRKKEQFNRNIEIIRKKFNIITNENLNIIKLFKINQFYNTP